MTKNDPIWKSRYENIECEYESVCFCFVLCDLKINRCPTVVFLKTHYQVVFLVPWRWALRSLRLLSHVLCLDRQNCGLGSRGANNPFLHLCNHAMCVHLHLRTCLMLGYCRFTYTRAACYAIVCSLALAQMLDATVPFAFSCAHAGCYSVVPSCGFAHMLDATVGCQRIFYLVKELEMDVLREISQLSACA